MLTASASRAGALAPLVLIAEDDRDTREMYYAYLQLSGFAIQQAQDGLSALQLTVELRPDVVVTDLALPGLDGFQLCDRVRHNDATRHIPVIAVTGHGFAGLDERAKLVGIDRVLVKPCLPENLVNEIRGVLTNIREPQGQTLEMDRAVGHPTEAAGSPLIAPAEGLTRRIRGEFDEMPGLNITLPQASRLLGVESQVCELALDWLVDSGFLFRTRLGFYRKRKSGD